MFGKRYILTSWVKWPQFLFVSSPETVILELDGLPSKLLVVCGVWMLLKYPRLNKKFEFNVWDWSCWCPRHVSFHQYWRGWTTLRRAWRPRIACRENLDILWGWMAGRTYFKSTDRFFGAETILQLFTRKSNKKQRISCVFGVRRFGDCHSWRNRARFCSVFFRAFWHPELRSDMTWPMFEECPITTYEHIAQRLNTVRICGSASNAYGNVMKSTRKSCGFLSQATQTRWLGYQHWGPQFCSQELLRSFKLTSVRGNDPSGSKKISKTQESGEKLRKPPSLVEMEAQIFEELLVPTSWPSTVIWVIYKDATLNNVRCKRHWRFDIFKLPVLRNWYWSSRG